MWKDSPFNETSVNYNIIKVYEHGTYIMLKLTEVMCQSGNLFT